VSKTILDDAVCFFFSAAIATSISDRLCSMSGAAPEAKAVVVSFRVLIFNCPSAAATLAGSKPAAFAKSSNPLISISGSGIISVYVYAPVSAVEYSGPSRTAAQSTPSVNGFAVNGIGPS